MRHNANIGAGGELPLPAKLPYGGGREGFRAVELLLFSLVTLAVMALCVCVGSVSLPLKETLTVIWNAIFRLPMPEGISVPIILSVRLPRVLCVALTGAALSLCGGAMQGLLKNPLADGSTLGVSSGASLGAVVAIAFSITLPRFPFAGTMVLAILFAFVSLLIILSLAYKIDYSMSTNTIILIGVIYSMFVSSILALIISFASDRVKQITFWTMGSLLGTSLSNAWSSLARSSCSAVRFCSSRGSSPHLRSARTTRATSASPSAG